MSAKEMFEKLGYVENKYKDCIEYVFESDSDIEVNFDYNTKGIFICERDCEGGHYPYPISIELLKAVQQQILELGWE